MRGMSFDLIPVNKRTGAFVRVQVFLALELFATVLLQQASQGFPVPRIFRFIDSHGLLSAPQVGSGLHVLHQVLLAHIAVLPQDIVTKPYDDFLLCDQHRRCAPCCFVPEVLMRNSVNY